MTWQAPELLRTAHGQDPLLADAAVVSPVGNASSRFNISVNDWDLSGTIDTKQELEESACLPVEIHLGTTRARLVLIGDMVASHAVGLRNLATTSAFDLTLTLGDRGDRKATIKGQFNLKDYRLRGRRDGQTVSVVLAFVTTGAFTGSSYTLEDDVPA